jgi:UDP-N-acetylglucosamine 4-epimerase
VSGEVFNLACGGSLSLNEVVEHIAQALECKGNIVYGPPRSGDVPHSLADISRARKYLGYEPRVEAKEGLERVVLWFRKADKKF